MKQYDLTEEVHRAWEYFDSILTGKIQHIHELTGVDKDNLIKLNPIDFVERSKGLIISGYKYQDITQFIKQNKRPDTFLISPIDEDVETANQINYKTGNITTRIRAHKCQIVPIPILVAKRFFVKNHRQTVPPLTNDSINFALVYDGIIVSVMTYDNTTSAVRGLSAAGKYELMRLAIRHGYQINGGASKLQKQCEIALLHYNISDIFSYSNATINQGTVYNALGFTECYLIGGQPWNVERDFTIRRLIFACKVRKGKGAKNSELFSRGSFKTHITANKMWRKHLEKKEYSLNEN